MGAMRPTAAGVNCTMCVDSRSALHSCNGWPRAKLAAAGPAQLTKHLFARHHHGSHMAIIDACLAPRGIRCRVCARRGPHNMLPLSSLLQISA